MPQSAIIEVEVDEETKRKASEALASLGVTPSELLKMVLEHLASGGELPFSTLIPNAETIEAMEAARRGETVGSATSIEELMALLHADD